MRSVGTGQNLVGCDGDFLWRPQERSSIKRERGAYQKEVPLQEFVNIRGLEQHGKKGMSGPMLSCWYQQTP